MKVPPTIHPDMGCQYKKFENEQALWNQSACHMIPLHFYPALSWREGFNPNARRTVRFDSSPCGHSAAAAAWIVKR